MSKTQGQIEAEISEAVIRFEKEYFGYSKNSEKPSCLSCAWK